MEIKFLPDSFSNTQVKGLSVLVSGIHDLLVSCPVEYQQSIDRLKEYSKAIIETSSKTNDEEATTITVIAPFFILRPVMRR